MHSGKFSDEALRDKLKHYARKVGLPLVETVLKLYYALSDDDTPKWAKTIICGALVYFIVPMDLIPDFLAGGYFDDMGALLSAVTAVTAHIKPEHAAKAETKARQWLGQDSVMEDTE